MNEPPAWLDPERWLDEAHSAGSRAVLSALAAETPGVRQFAVLLSAAAAGHLELIAHRARALTRQHFGKTIKLYAPLYLSNYCCGGCTYCGFAADRQQARHKLSQDQLLAEIHALKAMGLDEILLLTGERTPEADTEYLRQCVRTAADHVHDVNVETFAMSEDEYRQLVSAGCSGLTLYQETYDRRTYRAMHRWGPKQDYDVRLDAPARALRAGMRNAGIGVLFGLSEPTCDAIALYQHAVHLKKEFWQNGISVSFPRIRPQAGSFTAPFPVSEAFLAQMIFAFRICLPDTPLVLSTRESPAFRDGMAGLGISKMSVASRTTVGGYKCGVAEDEGQFRTSDTRDLEQFREMLKDRQLAPICKNWDSVYRQAAR